MHRLRCSGIFRQFSKNFPGRPPGPHLRKGWPPPPPSPFRRFAPQWSLRLQTLVLQQFWSVLQRKNSWTPLVSRVRERFMIDIFLRKITWNYSISQILHFCVASEAQCHIGITLSSICVSFCHALLLLAPHAFCRTLVVQTNMFMNWNVVLMLHTLLLTKTVCTTAHSTKFLILCTVYHQNKYRIIQYMYI